MSGYTLAAPWLLLLLPLPLIARAWLPSLWQDGERLVVPFLSRLEGGRPSPPRQRGWLTLLWCIWSLTVIALAGPQHAEPPLTQSVRTQDTLLLVDLSRSMETRDFTNTAGEQTSRLDAVKQVLAEFLAKRKNDRVGLIFFGSSAFIQAPFTDDLELCASLLAEARVGIAGPQTAFGDAIGLAIHQFNNSPAKEKTAIVLTDGNDTASKIPPTKAAQLARDITIHTVSIGSSEAVGEEALDEATLQSVAKTTGGLYAHAGDRAELEAIYTRLDQIEQHEAQTITHTPRRPLHAWFLLAALGLSIVGVSVNLFSPKGAAP